VSSFCPFGSFPTGAPHAFLVRGSWDFSVGAAPFTPRVLSSGVERRAMCGPQCSDHGYHASICAAHVQNVASTACLSTKCSSWSLYRPLLFVFHLPSRHLVVADPTFTANSPFSWGSLDSPDGEFLSPESARHALPVTPSCLLIFPLCSLPTHHFCPGLSFLRNCELSTWYLAPPAHS
jgi:hypothetical protein